MLAIALREHNAARAEVGVPPLVIDCEMSARARDYAEELARTNNFAHSDSSARAGEGENLWSGNPGGYFSFERMVGAWVEEKKYYRHGPIPNVSTTGSFADVGHYTQVIWKNTERLGCGLARNEGPDYLVCRYAPAGNVVGQYAY